MSSFLKYDIFKNIGRRFEPITVKYDKSLSMPAHAYKVDELRPYIKNNYPDFDYLKEEVSESALNLPNEQRIKK